MPRSKLKRILQSTLMLATIVGPLATMNSLAFAEQTEPGVTDYCVVGADQNQGGGNTSGDAKGPDVIPVKVAEDPATGDQAVRNLSKAIADAIGADPGLVYAQMNLESADGESAAAKQLKNFGGIKYSGATGESTGTNATDGVGGAYAKFDSLSAFASREAAILKRDGVDKMKTVQEYAHMLKEKGYYEATEEFYASGMEARLQQYYGGTGGGTGDAAGGGSNSSDDSSKGAWHKGDDDFAPDSLDTSFTTGFDDEAPQQQQQQDAGDIQASGDEEKTAKQIWDVLTKEMGFNGVGAAAMLGNFTIESHFNPMASNGTNFGIAQWNAGRLGAMNLKPGDSSSMTVDNEIKLMKQELNGKFKDVKMKVGAATDIVEATSIVNNQYEISGNAAEEDREKAAKQWYQKFNGDSVKGDATLLGATDAANAGATNQAANQAQGGAQCSNSDNGGDAVAGDWGWPFKSIKNLQDVLNGTPMVAQKFGHTRAGTGLDGGSDFHDGWDFQDATWGGQDVVAIHGGTVYKVAYSTDGRDWHVDVKSPDGYYETYQEGFASQSDIKVKEGDTVKTGDVIGKAVPDVKHTHTHVGISKTEIEKAQSSYNKDDGTWLNPVRVINKMPDPTKGL